MVAWSELPLHGGKVPPHLLKRMKGIAKGIVEVMVEEFGPEDVVLRLSDPFWFQAFNNVIGMDWDSSGSTTVVLGILKELTWKEDLGFLVLGGKGKNMLKVREEAEAAVKVLDVDPQEVVKASKASARLDSALVQDGYDLYIHSIIVSESVWTVIQQGMNDELGLARRYQINSLNIPWLKPHEAILGRKGDALDLASSKSSKAVETIVDVANEGPRKVINLIRAARLKMKGQRTLTGKLVLGDVEVKFYYPVRPSKQLERSLEKLYQFKPTRKEDLLVAPGVGPKTLRALALVSHLIYGFKPSFEDPVTHPPDPFAYAYAVGGKDGIPYPYDTKVADEVISILEDIINRAKLGDKEKLYAFRGLKRLVTKIFR